MYNMGQNIKLWGKPAGYFRTLIFVRVRTNLIHPDTSWYILIHPDISCFTLILCPIVSALQSTCTHPAHAQTSWSQVALGEHGEWQRCMELLAVFEPDRVCYNACMSACERSSQWEASLMMFSEMLQRDIFDADTRPHFELRNIILNIIPNIICNIILNITIQWL